MNPIIHAIADDLKIYPMPNETEGHFGARIIYSAMAQHFKTASHDKSIYEEKYNNGASVIHTKKRCRDILEQLILCVPESRKWFKPDIDENIEIIYSRLIDSGELMKNYDRYNFAKYQQRFAIDNRYFYTRGMTDDFRNKQASGLALIEQISLYDTKEKSTTMEDLFSILFEGSVNLWKSYIRNVGYEKLYSADDLELFDADLKTRTLYNCFTYKEEIPEGISLARKKQYEQGNMYYIIKRKNGITFYHKIEDYYIETKEHYKFRYALRHMHDNPVTAEYHLIDNLIYLHLNTKLPNAQMAFLLLISWTNENIDNMCHLIFSSVFWEIVKKMMNALGIKLLER